MLFTLYMIGLPTSVLFIFKEFYHFIDFFEYIETYFCIVFFIQEFFFFKYVKILFSVLNVF